MQLISFIVSVALMLGGLFVPTETGLERGLSQKAQNVDKAVSSLFEHTTPFFEEETNLIIEAIAKNLLIEAFTNESESEDLLAIAEQIPVYENGERDRNCENVTAGPLKKVFGEFMSKVIENTNVSGVVKDILVLIADGAYKMYFYFVPAEEEGLYVVYYDYVDNNGNVKIKNTGTYFDKNTGRIYSADGTGMMGIGFDYEIDNYVITTPVYAWQRNFGYTVAFDIVGEMGFMKTDTARIRFEHGGKHWMFQIWKGNYTFGLTNGAEIGIYHKDSILSPVYDCASDDEMLDMSMKVFYNNELLFEREKTHHWWLCDLKFGTPLPPEELVLDGTIEFEDEEMMSKFIESAKEYSDEMTVTADGMKVNIIWQ